MCTLKTVFWVKASSKCLYNFDILLLFLLLLILLLFPPVYTLIDSIKDSECSVIYLDKSIVQMHKYF